MLVEELSLKNIRCFRDLRVVFLRNGVPARWITFLGANGGGKSTILQALGLLLAGPDAARQLLPRPVGWLADEKEVGRLSIRVQQEDSDSGQFGSEKIDRRFGYTFYVTGTEPLKIRNKSYSEPAVIESQERRLTWLRTNAFAPTSKGWFAAGYGAFRRLTRSSEILNPTLEQPTRHGNFIAQFDEDKPLAAFERWMVHLDYRIAKSGDKKAARLRDIGVAAINQLLPDGVRFDSVTAEGRILFSTNIGKVPTISLSDGFRSILALAGDLIWRLIQTYPDSDEPLKREGVAIIDELDIHLHPVWQRQIAGWLREQFSQLQFIVATHSPLIAAGAGDDALTFRFEQQDENTTAKVIDNISVQSVDDVLQGPAFGLVSPFSPQTQQKIDRYDELGSKQKLTSKENQEFQMLLSFMNEHQPILGKQVSSNLEEKIDAYLRKTLSEEA